MIKIQYASDLHLEFRDNWSLLKEEPLIPSGDILVLAGDTGYLGDQNFDVHPFWDWASENYRQVIVCLGNHEFYKYYDLSSMNDGTVGEIRPNIHYYYNSVVHLDDVDIIVSTLWAHIDKENAYVTQHSVSDFYRIIYGDHLLTAEDFNHEHEKCLDFIKKTASASNAKAKIVVTHHVPSYLLTADEFIGSRINGAFTAELKSYIETSGIDYWIYGHSHRNIDKTIGNTKCVSNQLGYVSHHENVGFDRGRCIVL